MDNFESWKFRHLKKILKYKWSDYCSYVDILEKIRGYGINIGTMSMTIRRRRLMYLGHVMRMGDHRLPKIMLYGGINLGKRRSGGQETSYYKCVLKDLELFHIKESKDFSALEVLALNRKEWRSKVYEGAELFYKDWVKIENEASLKRHSDSMKKENSDVSEEEVFEG